MAKTKQASRNDGEFFDWEKHFYSGLEKKVEAIGLELEDFGYIILSDDANFFKLRQDEIAYNASRLYDIIDGFPQWPATAIELIEFQGGDTYSKIVNDEFKKIIKRLMGLRNSAMKEYTKLLEDNTLYGRTDYFADASDYENYLIGMNRRRNMGKAVILALLEDKINEELDRFKETLFNIIYINLEPMQTQKFRELFIDEKNSICDALNGSRSVKETLPAAAKPAPTKQCMIWDAFQAIQNALYGPIIINNDLAVKLFYLDYAFGKAVSSFPDDTLFNQMLHQDLDEKIPGLYQLIDNVDKLDQAEEFLLCRYNLYVHRLCSYNNDSALTIRYNRLESDLPKKKITEIVKKYSDQKSLDRLIELTQNGPTPAAP